ncbi:Enhancer of polycomb -like protein 1 [Halotydeus destructor]|nr:Enhancer of polycomb -like protein 1 [Halotydeus destructor]
MSKLQFRARALDATKPMPVFRAEEIPDLRDYAAINRAVPQMPTGMEKEEESEHHLQRAMSAQQAYGHTGELVIPTPEVFLAPEIIYNDLYPANYKLPRQLIHVQPFAIESDIPEYDMDSDDDAWLMRQSQEMDISSLKFETIIERLEKSSGQHVVTLNEAKVLLKEDEDHIIAIYDYWLNKRLSTQHPLIHQVKTEKRDGTNNSNPYVAFRRRTEKMQTRKNRKNDEASYEKMLKLRRDLTRAVNILELVKHREKTKHEHLKLTIDIFDKRYHIGDYSGQILADLQAARNKQHQPLFPINNNQFYRNQEKGRSKNDEAQPVKRRREYKRKPKADATATKEKPSQEVVSSDDEASRTQIVEEEDDPDGPYAFRRKQGCSYLASLTEQTGNWPWEPPEEGGMGDKRYRYCMTSISHPKPRYLGFARRRVGRGGRIIFDRVGTEMLNVPSGNDNTETNFNDEETSHPPRIEAWTHFRPKSPIDMPDGPSTTDETHDEVEEVEDAYDDDGNLIPVVTITSFADYVENQITL